MRETRGQILTAITLLISSKLCKGKSYISLALFSVFGEEIIQSDSKQMAHLAAVAEEYFRAGPLGIGLVR